MSIHASIHHASVHFTRNTKEQETEAMNGQHGNDKKKGRPASKTE
jgi:hypothetical protein